MDPYHLQKQVRDNSEDIRGFLSDLKSWEKEMKRKDKELSECVSDNQEIPPVRSKVKKAKQSNIKTLSEKEAKSAQRISSYDYSAWDKFDVEKACAEVEDKTETAEDVEEEEEDVSATRQKQNLNLESESDVVKLQEQAMYEKELGNQHVKNQRWTEAIACYSKAIECNPYDAIFYANRALCYLKTKKARFADMDCTSAIRLDNTYVKAYQRRALARVELGLKDDAKADFKKVLELEPNNAATKNELAKLDKPPPVIAKKDQKLMWKAVDTKSKSASLQEKSRLLTTNVGIQPSTSRIPAQPREHVPGAGGDAESLYKKPSGIETLERRDDSLLSEDGEEVFPINKPPHLRSKKPLCLVPVEEVESMEELTDLWVPCRKEKPDVKLIEEVSSISTEIKEDFSATEDKSSKDRPSNNEKKQLVVETEDTIAAPKDPTIASTHLLRETSRSNEKTSLNLPPAPTSSVQFFTSWKSVKSEPLLRFQYLKQVPGSELPRLFLESLESKEFSEILSSLAADFIEKQEPVFPYLLGLSQVKRFSALVMFLSKAEKTVIRKLIQYCEERSECSKEDLDNLKICYEVN